MPAKTAKMEKQDAPSPRLVVFVVYDNIVLLDLVGPLQVFSHALDCGTAKNGYECVVVSVDGGIVGTNTVVPIPTASIESLGNRPIHTLVIVGGDGAIKGMRDPALVGAVSSLCARAYRVCSVCSGALILAATGLLDARRAVTHWEDCDMLAQEFPGVTVEVDPIFIKDDHIWTSAGVTAGIDMALAIVSEDLGRMAALTLAKSIVVQMVRTGGQCQFSPALGRQWSDAKGRFDSLHTWMAENLAGPMSVESLAQRAGMSARNFARVYAEVMGVTPAKSVEAMRIERAKELLATTSYSLKRVASACGFGDEDRMRRAFLRVVKVLPTNYRQNFQLRG